MYRCDTGCGRRAATWWEAAHDHDGWALCEAHTREHEDALKRDGYELWMDARVEVAQTLVG